MKPDTKALFQNISDNTPTSLKALLNHPDYNIDNGELMCPLGLINEKKLLSVDMGKIPHMLIGGTTGSGKTSFIQTLITSLISQYSPEECQFIIFDSKAVDYMPLNGLPHLLIPITTDYRKAAGAINWAHAEGQRRLRLTQENSLEVNKLPHLFILLDDYADISMSYEAIEALYNVLKIGRATKIHCIISTALPLAKLIPTELKILVPCRIAFSMVSKLASRIIIDDNGAELLEAPGKILYKNHNKILKCRCAYISESDMQYILNELIHNIDGFSYYNEIRETLKVNESQDYSPDSDEIDSLFEKAGRFVIEHDKASIGMLQRCLKIGFNRAAKIMEQLENACVVNKEQGTKPRTVLMSLEDFEKYLLHLNSKEEVTQYTNTEKENIDEKPIAQPSCHYKQVLTNEDNCTTPLQDSVSIQENSLLEKVDVLLKNNEILEAFSLIKKKYTNGLDSHSIVSKLKELENTINKTLLYSTRAYYKSNESQLGVLGELLLLGEQLIFDSNIENWGISVYDIIEVSSVKNYDYYLYQFSGFKIIDNCIKIIYKDQNNGKRKTLYICTRKAPTVSQDINSILDHFIS